MALAATVVGAVKPLEIRGTDFVEADTGKRVQIVGAAYQPGGSAGYNPKVTGKDPLSDPETCLRDAALMQVMGINAIRVYNLSPDLNHDECASIFNAVCLCFPRGSLLLDGLVDHANITLPRPACT